MIESIIGGIGSAVGAVGNFVQNQQNMQMQAQQNAWQRQMGNKQFDYQQMLNQMQMDREDNAVQRRQADMAKAGINPLLAGGAPAEAGGMQTGGSTAQGPAPRMEGNPAEAMINNATKIAQTLNMKKDLEQKEATIEKTQAETENIKESTPNIATDRAKTEQNIQNLQEEKKGTKYSTIHTIGNNLSNMIESQLETMGIKGKAGISGNGIWGVNATIEGSMGTTRKVFIPTADLAEDVYNGKLTQRQAVQEINRRIHKETSESNEIDEAMNKSKKPKPKNNEQWTPNLGWRK